MRILAIETSCDETAFALLEDQGEELGSGKLPLDLQFENVASQVKLHDEFGGVVPELAAREHLKALPLLLHELETAQGKSLRDLELDYIAATTGPGLKGCLLMGLSFAIGLSAATAAPLIGVNHIEGHLLSGFLNSPNLKFPFLGLIVSGGHTELVAAHAVGEYELIARTRDDAAGEAFDKSAKLIGLPYPGGAELSKLGATVQQTELSFPVAIPKELGFSFSGLKTAVARHVKSAEEKDYPEVARAVEDSIVKALVMKTKRALEQTGFNRLVLCGGVSANRTLRAALEAIDGLGCFFPEMKHCTDNAAMIGAAAALRLREGLTSKEDRMVRSRWPLEEYAAQTEARRAGKA